MTAAQLNIIEFILSPKQCGYGQNLVEMIRDLQLADAEQLAEFGRCFVDNIICRQILPRLFVQHEKMLDIKLSFKPEIEEKDVSMYYGITVVVATDGSEQQLTQSFFDGCISDYNYLNQLLTDNQMSAFIWCTVLGHVVGRNERLRLKLDNMAAKTTFARLYSLPELLLPVIIDLPDSFDSLLADLIADGYDLASLQSFLTG